MPNQSQNIDYKNILAVVDPKHEQQPAVERAIKLAKAYNASITLFCNEYDSGLVYRYFLNEEQLQKAQQALVDEKKKELEQLSQSIAAEGIPLAIDCQWGKNLYEQVLKAAEKHGCDLVVKSTHKHPAIKKLFLNPTDWQLLKTSPVPLFLVKDREHAYQKKIIVAVDVMDEDEHALNQKLLETGINFAQKLGAELHVIHSYHLVAWDLMRDVIDGSGGYYVGVDDHVAYEQKTKEIHLSKLKELVADYNIDDDSIHLVEGPAEIAIPEAAEKMSAGYILVGTTYRTGLLGSTAESILDNVESDVIAIKRPGFEPPEL